MSYLVQSWIFCANTDGSQMGEEAFRTIRVRHHNHVHSAIVALRADHGICRITMMSDISPVTWDLYRTEARDTRLDSSMRAVDPNVTMTGHMTLDVGPGVTQAQVAAAQAILKPK